MICPRCKKENPQHKEMCLVCIHQPRYVHVFPFTYKKAENSIFIRKFTPILRGY